MLKQTISQTLTEQFLDMKNNENWTSLGWWFWKGFAIEQGQTRKVYSKLWDSLTKSQQQACENI